MYLEYSCFDFRQSSNNEMRAPGTDHKAIYGTQIYNIDSPEYLIFMPAKEHLLQTQNFTLYSEYVTLFNAQLYVEEIRL